MLACEGGIFLSAHHDLSGKTFSILGDSYSTFQGYIPEEYQYYYPAPHNVEDVLRVEDTWWYQLAENLKMKLLVNNSFSGSTVCENVREGWPASCAFTIRSSECDLALDSEHTPDYIFVFGCTNDYWIGRTLGNVQFHDWSTEDLQDILPAYCYVLEQLSLRYPHTTLVTVINDELDVTLREGILQVSKHYHCMAVDLKNIDKQNGHPTARGMSKIAAQIQAVILATEASTR